MSSRGGSSGPIIIYSSGNGSKLSAQDGIIIGSVLGGIFVGIPLLLVMCYYIRKCIKRCRVWYGLYCGPKPAVAPTPTPSAPHIIEMAPVENDTTNKIQCQDQSR